MLIRVEESSAEPTPAEPEAPSSLEDAPEAPSRMEMEISGRSVLSCIEADFCDQILILQRFSSSTRFCTFAPIEIQKFWKCSSFFLLLLIFLQISNKFHVEKINKILLNLFRAMQNVEIV